MIIMETIIIMKYERKGLLHSVSSHFCIYPFPPCIFPLWYSQRLLKAVLNWGWHKRGICFVYRIVQIHLLWIRYLANQLLFYTFYLSLHAMPGIILGTGKARWASPFMEPAFQGFLLTPFLLAPEGHRLAAHPCSFRLKHNPACLSLKHQLPCLLSLCPFFLGFIQSWRTSRVRPKLSEVLLLLPNLHEEHFQGHFSSWVGPGPNTLLGIRKISWKITIYFPLNKPVMMLINRFYFKT